jgi:hypothetical protein
VVTQQQVQQRRQQLAQAQRQIEEQQRRLPQITQEQLRGGQFATRQGIIARKQLSKSRARLGEKEREIQEARSQFERQIALSAPQYATQEALQSLKQRTKGYIKNRIESLKDRLNTAFGEEKNRIRAEIRTLEKAQKLPTQSLAVAIETGQLDRAVRKSRLQSTYLKRGVISQITGKTPEYTREEISKAFSYSVEPELLTQQEKQKLEGIRYFEKLKKGEIKFEPVAPEIVPFSELPFTERALIKLGYGEVKGITPVYGQSPSLFYGGTRGEYAGEAMYAVTRDRFAPTLTTSFLTETGLTSTALRPVGGVTPKLTSVSLKPKPGGFYETYVKDIPKGIKTAVKGKEVTIPVQVRATPTTSQIVISDPRLKRQVIETLPEKLVVKEKPISVVLSETRGTTGQVRVLRRPLKKDKVLGYEPPLTTKSIGVSQPETGLYKVLPKKQTEVLAKKTEDILFKREFGSAKDLEIGKGVKIKSESFISTTEFPLIEETGIKPFTIKGLGKFKQVKPKKIQRTGEIKGFLEEYERGLKELKEGVVLPYSKAEGILGFKPLYRFEPAQFQRVKLFSMGEEGTEKVLFTVTRQLQLPSLAKIRPSPLPIYQTASGKTITQDLGLGIPKPISITQEQTKTQTLVPKTKPSIQKPKEETRVKQIMIKAREIEKEKFKDIQKIAPSERIKGYEEVLQEQLQIQKKLTKQLSKQSIKSRQRIRERTKQIQKALQIPSQIQLQKQTTGQITRQVPKVPAPRIPLIPRTKISGSISYPKISKQAMKSQSKAYQLLIKRFGKYKPIKITTRGRALKLGEEITRKTLAASFKVVPTKKLITQKDIDYSVGKEFRQFKIKKGKRIPLLDEFIQKKGTRLGTKSEVSEIMGFRKRRKKR